MIDRDRINAARGVKGASPRPWTKCTAEDGKCQCGLIWAEPADAIVCVCKSHRNSDTGEGFSEEVMHANQDFILEAITMYDRRWLTRAKWFLIGAALGAIPTIIALLTT